MSENWITTFYYQQELTSEYMNSTLGSTLSPGIFNCNIYLTTTAPIGSSPGVYLHINKGTTLCFSNSITSNKTRNLDGLGDYFVKCTAQNDIDQLLMSTINDPLLSSNAIMAMEFLETPAEAPIIYVYATMQFDPNPVNATPYSVPIIKVAKVWNKAVNTIPTSTEQETDFTYEGYLAESTSYLILGSIVDIQRTHETYITGGAWKTSSSENGAVTWIKNHVFTGRGLPEYQKDPLRGAINFPDIYFNGINCNYLYVSSQGFVYKNVFTSVNSLLSWQKMYGQNSETIGFSYPAVPTPQNCSYTVGNEFNNTKDSYVAYNFDVTQYNEPNITYSLIEVLFLAAKTNEASSPSTDVSTGETLIDLSTILNNSSSTLSIKPVWFCSKVANGYLDSRLGAYSLYDFGSSNTTPQNILPLDVNQINIKRLTDIINSQNFIPLVTEYARQRSTHSPYLDGSDTTDLIPIAILSRGIKDGAFIEDHNIFTNSVGVSVPMCNPTNILAFTNLQYGTSKMNVLDFGTSGIYTILPFLD